MSTDLDDARCRAAYERAVGRPVAWQDDPGASILARYQVAPVRYLFDVAVPTAPGPTGGDVHVVAGAPPGDVAAGPSLPRQGATASGPSRVWLEFCMGAVYRRRVDEELEPQPRHRLVHFSNGDVLSVQEDEAFFNGTACLVGTACQSSSDVHYAVRRAAASLPAMRPK